VAVELGILWGNDLEKEDADSNERVSVRQKEKLRVTRTSDFRLADFEFSPKGLVSARLITATSAKPLSATLST